MENKEKSLVFIKPDCIEQSEDIKKILLENCSDLKKTLEKETVLTREQIKKHYAHLEDKPFFEGLVDYISSGKIKILILEGRNAISKIRDIVGSTNPEEAKEGTIRKMFGTDIEKNAVHASDSPENAEKEIVNLV
jgi:nucleoside-diphosphate kinase